MVERAVLEHDHNDMVERILSIRDWIGVSRRCDGGNGGTCGHRTCQLGELTACDQIWMRVRLLHYLALVAQRVRHLQREPTPKGRGAANRSSYRRRSSPFHSPHRAAPRRVTIRRPPTETSIAAICNVRLTSIRAVR